MRRRRRFHASLAPRGFTPTRQRELRLRARFDSLRAARCPGLLQPGTFESHVRFALSSVRPFASLKASEVRARALSASAPLLRPLLTSRPPPHGGRPFRLSARSPQVRACDVPRAIVGSTPLAFGRKGFAVICPLTLARHASYPPHLYSWRRCFLFVDSRFLLPASFSVGLTTEPRFSPALHLAVRSGSLRPAPPVDSHLLITPMLGTQKWKPPWISPRGLQF